MEFVDKKTGEIFEVEETDLMNVCGGDVNRVFKHELKKLVSQMAPGDKGGITIKIKLEAGYKDGVGEVCVMEAGLVTKYPTISLTDVQENMQGDNGEIVRRKEKNLFTGGSKD